MDWKIALKVGGPSVIAAWLFHALVIQYLDSSEIFKSNIYLNVILIVGGLWLMLFLLKMVILKW